MDKYDAVVCITTGLVSNGKVVAEGDIRKQFGRLYLKYGESVYILKHPQTPIISFPVSLFGEQIDLSLVEKSSRQIKELADLNSFQNISVPLPAIGLEKSVLDEMLDKRFDVFPEFV